MLRTRLNQILAIFRELYKKNPSARKYALKYEFPIGGNEPKSIEGRADGVTLIWRERKLHLPELRALFNNGAYRGVYYQIVVSNEDFQNHRLEEEIEKALSKSESSLGPSSAAQTHRYFEQLVRRN